MPYRVVRSGALFICVWHAPARADAARLCEDLKAARAGGAPLHFVGFIAPNAGVPDQPTRRELTERMRLIQDMVDGTYMVIEGDNIRGALIRTMIRSMSVLSGVRPRRVCSSLAEVLAAIGDSARTTLAQTTPLVDEARPR